MGIASRWHLPNGKTGVHWLHLKGRPQAQARLRGCLIAQPTPHTCLWRPQPSLQGRHTRVKVFTLLNRRLFPDRSNHHLGYPSVVDPQVAYLATTGTYQPGKAKSTCPETPRIYKMTHLSRGRYLRPRLRSCRFGLSRLRVSCSWSRIWVNCISLRIICLQRSTKTSSTLALLRAEVS